MKTNLTFKERAKLVLEMLSKQKQEPITLEEARALIKKRKKALNKKNKK